jgi:cytochrome c oxidase assembly protein subunit 15
MSGAKAALPYPSWPDMNGAFLPPVLSDTSMWTVENMVYYEATLFQPALIQFLHRMTAYTLIIMVIAYLFQSYKYKISPYFKAVNGLLITLLITQALLGIATLMGSIGEVPVGLGVAHQFGAIALVGVFVYINYQFWPGKPLRPVDKTVENVV